MSAFACRYANFDKHSKAPLEIFCFEVFVLSIISNQM